MSRAVVSPKKSLTLWHPHGGTRELSDPGHSTWHSTAPHPAPPAPQKARPAPCRPASCTLLKWHWFYGHIQRGSIFISACGSNNCLDFNIESTFQWFAFKCVVREVPEIFNKTTDLHFNVHLKNFKKSFHVNSVIWITFTFEGETRAAELPSTILRKLLFWDSLALLDFVKVGGGGAGVLLKMCFAGKGGKAVVRPGLVQRRLKSKSPVAQPSSWSRPLDEAWAWWAKTHRGIVSSKGHFAGAHYSFINNLGG